MNILKRIPIYPFLFGLYPVLALLADNLDQIKPVVAWRSLIAISVVNLFFLIFFRVIFQNWYIAAANDALFLILFFTYGHLYEYLDNANAVLSQIARHRFLIPLFLILLTIGLLWLRKNVRKATSATLLLNLIAITSIAIPLLRIASFEVRIQKVYSEYQDQIGSTQPGTLDHPIDTLPDIYYIILDGYSRDDILLESYSYDNTPFMNTLADMGFYIARCSQSNYAQTELSMASAFNMDYLENLGESFVESSDDRSELWPLLDHGRVRQVLDDIGYKIVAFETGFYWIQWEDADVYLAPTKSKETGESLFGRGLNSFEEMLIQTTMGRVLIDNDLIRHIRELIPDIKSYDLTVRNRTLFVLDQLRFDKVPAILGPKFIYAHIISPHDPFVFGPDSEVAQSDDKFTYVDQVKFINRQIEQILNEIITNSDIPPIIILQGDHGYGVTHSGRMAILNAIYFPGDSNQNLYPTMTPVNTFRLLFNEFLGGEFKILEDLSYYSTYENPYKFEVIPISREGCGD